MAWALARPLLRLERRAWLAQRRRLAALRRGFPVEPGFLAVNRRVQLSLRPELRADPPSVSVHFPAAAMREIWFRPAYAKAQHGHSRVLENVNFYQLEKMVSTRADHHGGKERRRSPLMALAALAGQPRRLSLHDRSSKKTRAAGAARSSFRRVGISRTGPAEPGSFRPGRNAGCWDRDRGTQES